MACPPFRSPRRTYPRGPTRKGQKLYFSSQPNNCLCRPRKEPHAFGHWLPGSAARILFDRDRPRGYKDTSGAGHVPSRAGPRLGRRAIAGGARHIEPLTFTAESSVTMLAVSREPSPVLDRAGI